MQTLLNLGYFKKFLNSPSRKKLAKNFASLSLLQVISYAFPLITLPYLVRVLGAEKFGIISFAQAFISFFVIVTDYGFIFSATKEISVNRDDKTKISEIFSSVMAAKALLGILSLAFISLILFFVPRFGNEWLVYAFSFGAVVENIIFPTWFFQGMEKMERITAITIISKFIFTLLVFIFIKSAADYVYVPLISFLGSLAAGALSMKLIIGNFGVKVRVPSSKDVVLQFRKGWNVFLSIISINVYYNCMPFVLGLLASNTAVGYYSAGEKIIKAIDGALTPLSRTVYPHIGSIGRDSKENAFLFIRKILKMVAASTLVLSLAVFVFARQISAIILGPQFTESISVIRILAFIPFVRQCGYVFLLQTMLNFGHDRAMFKISLAASAISIITAFVAIPHYFQNGAALAVLTAELVALILSAAFVEKKYGILSGKKSA